MTQNEKEKINNLYKIEPIEENAQNKLKEVKKEETKYQKKKRKEREKRIKEKQKSENEKFDFETETVIGMAQKNRKKQEKIQIKKIEDKNERRRKKKVKLIKKIVKWLTIIILLVGGTTFAMVSPMFNIQEIKVVENEKVSLETIISLSELNKGQNIFRFLTSQIEEKIKKEPYIQDVQVKRVFPNQIQITVKERKRRFSAEFLNGYAYINTQGYILEISNDKSDLPVIQGISTTDDKIVAGNRLENTDLEKLEIVVKIMNAYKSSELDNEITSIDITDKNDYIIYMEKQKKTIHLGNEKNLGDKILWVQAILKDNEGKEGEIYVNGDLTNNFRPRFKEKV